MPGKKEEMLEAMKKVRAQLARRYIDTSNLNVTISGGNVHMTGAIRKLRAHPNVDLKTEMDQISQILRHIPGIREVVWDVALRS
ncbi:MAG TPA: BON domain-containing protein [Chthonomonadaceae bacterium]|nr:BON domain-containing protein [Chthonomonadaceae bacterium]